MNNTKKAIIIYLIGYVLACIMAWSQMQQDNRKKNQPMKYKDVGFVLSTSLVSWLAVAIWTGVNINEMDFWDQPINKSKKISI